MVSLQTDENMYSIKDLVQDSVHLLSVVVLGIFIFGSVVTLSFSILSLTRRDNVQFSPFFELMHQARSTGDNGVLR